MNRGRMIPCATGLLAFSCGATWAQEVPTTTAAMLEEVTVTAQRREESAQRTSLAIEVLSAKDIYDAGVADPASIANLVSGVNVAFAGATVQTFIRGVGSIVANGFGDSAIAYNVDGVYVSRTSAVSGLFYDLQRIEVLKGPQGTLYGRNASGGAINLITNRPTQDFEGNVSAEIGDYDLVRVTGALNLPASDVLSFRTAFFASKRDGYAYDNYYDEDTRAARLHALYSPNDDVSLLLSADVARIGGKGPIGIRIGAGDPATDDPWHDRAASAPTGLPSYRSTVPWANDLYAPDNSGFVDLDLWNVSAQFDWNLDWSVLSIVPAYRSMDLEQISPAGGFFYQDHQTSKQKTLEVRLGNSTDTLKWVGGAYYFREDQTQQYFVDQGVNISGLDTPLLDTESWALFGEMTYSISPALRAIAGLRYTEEKKSVSGTQVNTTPYPTYVRDYILPSQVPPFLLSDAQYACGDAIPPFPNPSRCSLPVTGSTSANEITWKGGFEYDLTDDNMLFFTVAKGFKGGGVFNTKFADPTYKPEELRAYTLGFRNRFLEDRVQLNLETFYWKYLNKQEAGVRFDPVEGLGFIIRNAAEAKLYGADLELDWQATHSDRIGLSVEYVKSEYEDFTYVLSGAGTTNCVETQRPDQNFNIDCSGKVLPRAPTWSGNLSYAHTFDLPNGGGLTAAVRGQYSSATFMDVTYASTARVDSWTAADADLTYDSPGDQWSIGAWIRNIGDEAIYTGGTLYPFTPQVSYATIRPPRTFGLRAAFNF